MTVLTECAFAPSLSRALGALCVLALVGCAATESVRPDVEVIALGGRLTGQEIAMTRALERDLVQWGYASCPCAWTATVDAGAPEASSAQRGRVSGSVVAITTRLVASCAEGEVASQRRMQIAMAGPADPLEVVRTALASAVHELEPRLGGYCGGSEPLGDHLGEE